MDSTLGKPALNQPAGADAATKAIFARAMKLSQVRSPELLTLQEHFEGDHELIVDKHFQKPPNWSLADWATVRKIILHVNSTRTSARILCAGVYGGVQVRKIEGDGEHVERINEYIASPEYRAVVQQVLLLAALYDHAAPIPEYDVEADEISVYLPNPVSTHILPAPTRPDFPVVLVEHDQMRGDWVRVWTRDATSILARDPADVSMRTWERDGAPAARPFFPALLVYGEKLPGKTYGLSLLRDTPRFNHNLSTATFNAAFTSKVKALALLAITSSDSEGEVKADTTQLGPHTALILPKGAAAQFLSNNADVGALMDVVDSLQTLEAFVLGLPNIQAQKNLSAEGARLAANPLTSQVQQLARRMALYEARLIQLIASVIHWETGDAKTPKEIRELYRVAVRLEPSINTESLGERCTSYLALANAGAVPEEDVVAIFNQDMGAEEITEQAEIMRERQTAKAAPPPAPAAGVVDAEQNSAGPPAEDEPPTEG